MRDLVLDRRDLLLAPLLAAAASSFGIGVAQAAGVDPTMTIVVPPDKIPWQPLYNFPPGAAEQAAMVGAIGEAGQYFVLIRWHPGFMSAPHWYETDLYAWSFPEPCTWQAARTSCLRRPSRRRPARSCAATVFS